MSSTRPVSEYLVVSKNVVRYLKTAVHLSESPSSWRRCRRRERRRTCSELLGWTSGMSALIMYLLSHAGMKIRERTRGRCVCVCGVVTCLICSFYHLTKLLLIFTSPPSPLLSPLPEKTLSLVIPTKKRRRRRTLETTVRFSPVCVYWRGMVPADDTEHEKLSVEQV